MKVPSKKPEGTKPSREACLAAPEQSWGQGVGFVVGDGGAVGSSYITMALAPPSQ